MWFIGRDEEWYVPAANGLISSPNPNADGWLDADMPNLRPGSSGGPLVTNTGIIGMVKAKSIDDTRVLSIECIKNAVRDWGYQWELVNANESSSIVRPDDKSKDLVGRSNWLPVTGSWQFSDGAATQTEETAQPGLAVIRGTENATELTCEARRTSGNDGFSIIASYENVDLALWWDIGGYGGKKSIAEYILPGDHVWMMLQTDRPFVIETDRWYVIHLERKGSRVVGIVGNQALLDINIPDRISSKGMFGLRTWSSTVEFRNVNVR